MINKGMSQGQFINSGFPNFLCFPNVSQTLQLIIAVLIGNANTSGKLEFRVPGKPILAHRVDVLIKFRGRLSDEDPEQP